MVSLRRAVGRPWVSNNFRHVRCTAACFTVCIDGCAVTRASVDASKLPQVETAEFDWQDADSSPVSAREFDVVLAADVIYFEEMVLAEFYRSSAEFERLFF